MSIRITSRFITCKAECAAYSDDEVESLGVPEGSRSVWVDLKMSWDAVKYIYMYVLDGVEVGTMIVDFSGKHVPTNAPYRKMEEMYTALHTDFDLDLN